MRSRTHTPLFFLALALAFLFLAALPLAAEHPGEGGRPLTATLSGDAEVPGPGDADGSGSFSLTVNPGQEEVCYELAVADIEPATAAHIHTGAPGESGPPVVTLATPTDGASADCVEVTRELATEIVRNPGGYYVNVHNEEFPDGAVRGQLAK
jgi:hypothetical protein